MHKYGGPDDKFHFTITVCPGQREALLMQSGINSRGNKRLTSRMIWRTVKKWHQITSPRMQKVDGSELRDAVIGNCTAYGCIKTGHNEEEWLQNLTSAMRKSFLWKLWLNNMGKDADQFILDSWIKQVDEKIAQLKANFPRGGPYVLTHGDLCANNIFISHNNEDKKFKVSAILDWAETTRAQRSVFEVLGKDSDVFHPGYDTRDRERIWEAVSPIMEPWEDGGNHTWSKHVPD